MEIWKSIPGFPKHQVSNMGGIRRLRDRKPPIHHKTELDKDGYLRARIGYRGASRKDFLHRLVYECFNGQLVKGLVVCHLDGDKTNNAAGNLVQLTQKENIAHKKLHGTWQEGERHPHAKINSATARKIKARLANIKTTKTGRAAKGELTKIADELGVSVHIVRDIRLKGAWSCAA